MKSRKTEWGMALNFDDEHAGPVRELIIMNARYWISEFHLDGLRVDATQAVFDDSPSHILAEISTAARQAAGKRRIVMIAENEPQNVQVLKQPGQKGYGFDAMWNDDFHHSAMVALTGRSEAYYSDYLGIPRSLSPRSNGAFCTRGNGIPGSGSQGGRPLWASARSTL